VVEWGRQFEHDHLRPAPGDYLDRLVADLHTAVPPPPSALTLADLDAIVARLRPDPHVLFTHPDLVDALRRARSARGGARRAVDP
jgi:hypothetical protein